MKGEPYILDESRFLEVVGIEVETAAAATHPADGVTPVPTCPGWIVAEVVRLLGSVFRVARLWLAGGARPWEWQAQSERPEDTGRSDVTVCGDPVQTYLWLRGRAAPGMVSVKGMDEDAAGQLWALLRLATR